MMKSQVRVDLTDFDAALDDINHAINVNTEEIADTVLEHARNSTEFEDKTGTLRRSIKKRESKYWDGGFIVFASAPHAHLVEFPHDIIRNGKIIGQVEGKFFLSKAKEQGIKRAIQLFKAAG